MPAWEYRLSNDSLWSVVGFLAMLPRLDVKGYEAVLAAAATRHVIRAPACLRQPKVPTCCCANMPATPVIEWKVWLARASTRVRR